MLTFCISFRVRCFVLNEKKVKDPANTGFHSYPLSSSRGWSFVHYYAYVCTPMYIYIQRKFLLLFCYSFYLNCFTLYLLFCTLLLAINICWCSSFNPLFHGIPISEEAHLFVFCLLRDSNFVPAPFIISLFQMLLQQKSLWKSFCIHMADFLA